MVEKYKIQFENNNPLEVEDSPMPHVGDFLQARLVRPVDCYRGTGGILVPYVVREVVDTLVRATETDDPAGKIQKKYLINSSSEGNRCTIDDLCS